MLALSLWLVVLIQGALATWAVDLAVPPALVRLTVAESQETVGLIGGTQFGARWQHPTDSGQQGAAWTHGGQPRKLPKLGVSRRGGREREAGHHLEVLCPNPLVTAPNLVLNLWREAVSSSPAGRGSQMEGAVTEGYGGHSWHTSLSCGPADA